MNRWVRVLWAAAGVGMFAGGWLAFEGNRWGALLAAAAAAVGGIGGLLAARKRPE